MFKHDMENLVVAMSECRKSSLSQVPHGMGMKTSKKVPVRGRNEDVFVLVS